MKVSDTPHNQPHDATFAVNNASVVLPIGDYTGAQIKAAAIEQGVPDIRPEFVLSVSHGSGYQIIGDTDIVHIHPHLDFLAVIGDDNS